MIRRDRWSYLFSTVFAVGLIGYSGADASDGDPPLPPQMAAGSDQEGCVPGGGGLLRVMLTGTYEQEVDWDNRGTGCGGFGTPEGMVVNFLRELGDQGSLTLMFAIDSIAAGETGSFPVGIAVSGQAVAELGGIFQTPDGACTIDVTEHALLQQGVGGASYRVAANGSCNAPSTAMFGGNAITLGNFEFVGVAAWAGM